MYGPLVWGMAALGVNGQDHVLDPSTVAANPLHVAQIGLHHVSQALCHLVTDLVPIAPAAANVRAGRDPDRLEPCGLLGHGARSLLCHDHGQSRLEKALKRTVAVLPASTLSQQKAGHHVTRAARAECRVLVVDTPLDHESSWAEICRVVKEFYRAGRTLGL